MSFHENLLKLDKCYHILKDLDLFELSAGGKSVIDDFS